jgi:hypothetical protein
VKWADSFSPHDWPRLRAVLAELLDRVRASDPERWAVLETVLGSECYEGLVVCPVGDGWCEVFADEMISVGWFHVGVLRADSTTPN